MWSISCNIQHLAHQQSKHKIRWPSLQASTFRHHRRENMANCPSGPHDNVNKRMKARAAWNLNVSEPLERSAACYPKRSLQWRTNQKETLSALKRRNNESRIVWKQRPLWRDSELKTQRQELSDEKCSTGGIDNHIPWHNMWGDVEHHWR